MLNICSYCKEKTILLDFYIFHFLKHLMFLYVDWLDACMLHTCALYAAIKLIISGSYVTPYTK